MNKAKISEPIENETNEKRPYNFSLSDKIHEKIEQNIQLIRFFEGGKANKQTYVIQAIKDKLVDDKSDPLSLLKPNKSIFVKIDLNLEEQIKLQVEWIKKHRTSYTKKRWIEDALLQKIDKDEKKWKHKMDKQQESLNN